MKRWQRISLRTKLSLGIALTLLIVLGIAFVGALQYIQGQLWQRETQSAENLNAMTAATLQEAMMAGHKETIRNSINLLGQSVGGRIDSIAVYDDQSILTSFASGFPGGREISRESVEIQTTDSGCWECHQIPSGERPTLMVINLEGKEVLRNVVPLYNETRCQTCHGTGQAVLGDSIVDIRLDQYQLASTTISLGLGISVAFAIVVVLFVLFTLVRRIVVNPLDEVIHVSKTIIEGDLDQSVTIRSADEIGQLGQSFNEMTSQLRELLRSLEQRVLERTRDLAQRSSYLEASAEVSQRAASVLEPDTLIQQAVELIRDRFNLYYVGLFLVDEKSEWAVLRAGTGEAGRAMLDRNHRIKIGEGMIGWSIRNSQARIALDVGDDAVRFDNPFLPNTRSEGALPLRSRGRVIGALTVQSVEEEAFNEDTITVFQTMADQIATALDNAQLLVRAQTALEAERRAYGELSQQAWKDLLETQTDLGVLVSSAQDVRNATHEWTPEMIKASEQGEIVRTDNRTITVPIILRDQVLGVVRLSKNEDEPDWTDTEIELMNTLVDQFENALESARLYSDTQRRAVRERLVTEITTKIRSSTDPQEMLQTAIKELKQAFAVHRVQVLVQSTQNE